MFGKSANSIDFTYGKIFPKLIAFALPMAFATLFQVLFNTADILMVGHFGGENGYIYQGAVGSTSSLVHLIVNFIVGISVGANVAMANAFGAKDDEKQFRVLHTSIALSLVLGALTAVVGICVAQSVLTLIGTPENILPYSAQYLIVYFTGVPGLIVYNFGAAILRGVGETRKPLIYLLIAGIVNVIVNFVLIAFFDMNVTGVAIGTAVSQYLAAALVICDLIKNDKAKLSIGKIRFYSRETEFILISGIPIGVTSSLFSLSNLFIQSTLNRYGSKAIAGDSIAKNIDTYIDAFTSAIEKSVVTMIAQNYGAKKYERFGKILAAGMIACIAFTGLYSGLVIFAGKYICLLFSGDQMVIEWAYKRLFFIGGFEILVTLMYTYGAALRGMGYAFLPMTVNLFFVCFVRIIFVTVFFGFLPQAIYLDMPTEMPRIEYIYALYPATWAMAGLVQTVIYYLSFNKIKKSASDKADLERMEQL